MLMQTEQMGRAGVATNTARTGGSHDAGELQSSPASCDSASCLGGGTPAACVRHYGPTVWVRVEEAINPSQVLSNRTRKRPRTKQKTGSTIRLV